MIDVNQLAKKLVSGQRAALSRSITLVESKRPEHRSESDRLLELILPYTGKAKRIGITGVPGAGKSSFIECLGTMLTGMGHKVAVLAVDPSSNRSKGSILGDKTRMEKLAVNPNSFIRPSPTAGELGGVAAMTRESILLCEAAGYEIILVETVGVGQSEYAVANMVDFFLALMLPGAGDELQGIKKGIIELADMIVVNKSDGENIMAAELAAQHYRRALSIIEAKSKGWTPPVLLASSIEKTGVSDSWIKVNEYLTLAKRSGIFGQKRKDQNLGWMEEDFKRQLLISLEDDAEFSDIQRDLRHRVLAGDLAPTRASSQLIDKVRARLGQSI